MSHPTSIVVSRQQIMDRARSAIGTGVYRLGAGGRDPSADSPLAYGQCDCSGFISWCCGLDRYQPDFGWLSTDGMLHAADSGFKFTRVETPLPGDVVVYGDYTGTDGQHHQGHVALVTASAPWGKWAKLKIIHCSVGNAKMFGHAIAETGADVFGRHDSSFLSLK